MHKVWRTYEPTEEPTFMPTEEPTEQEPTIQPTPPPIEVENNGCMGFNHPHNLWPKYYVTCEKTTNKGVCSVRCYNDPKGEKVKAKCSKGDWVVKDDLPECEEPTAAPTIEVDTDTGAPTAEGDTGAPTVEVIVTPAPVP